MSQLLNEGEYGSAKARFVQTSGNEERISKIWRGIKVSNDELKTEAQRLMSAKPRKSGLRRSYIVHPESETNTITPGIRAAIEVILPGETADLKQRNTSSVGLSIAGTVAARVDGATLRIDKYDVWSIPNMAKVAYVNEGSEPHVRLTFSDAPLFEYLHALHISDGLVAAAAQEDYKRDPMADFIHRLPTGGSAIKTYHAFIDPEAVENAACLWKWEEVRDFLNTMEKDTSDLRAAIIGLLWNPATGRTNGSTNTLTACMNGGVDPNWTSPAWNMARPHRHNITALNYGIAGRWKTIVDGKEIEWGPGDLVLTAPAWATHANGRMDREGYTFTIHDNPLLSALNAAMIQEHIEKPPLHVGARRVSRA